MNNPTPSRSRRCSRAIEPPNAIPGPEGTPSPTPAARSCQRGRGRDHSRAAAGAGASCTPTTSAGGRTPAGSSRRLERNRSTARTASTRDASGRAAMARRRCEVLPVTRSTMQTSAVAPRVWRVSAMPANAPARWASASSQSGVGSAPCASSTSTSKSWRISSARRRLKASESVASSAGGRRSTTRWAHALRGATSRQKTAAARTSRPRPILLRFQDLAGQTHVHALREARQVFARDDRRGLLAL